jgi:hypothetical protein
MRAAKVCVALVVLSVLLLAVACGTNAGNIKAALQGRHFVSKDVEMHFVTTSVPGQVVSGHFDVYFTPDKVEWQAEEDIMDSGPYQVDGAGNIKATGWWSGPVEGKYDTKSGRLLWDGAWYSPR